MKPGAIIFDMDGLMFDTERLSNQLWDRIREETGWSFHKDMPDIRGMNSRQIAAIFRERYGSDKEYLYYKEIKSEYQEEYIRKNGVPIKKGLFELLNYLKENGIPMAVATSTNKEKAEIILEKADVLKYFRVAVYGDMVEEGKPNPEIFYKTANALHISPPKTMVLEDSINGVKAGVAGGFITIMIPDLIPPNDTVREDHVLVLDSLLDVIAILQNENDFLSSGDRIT